MVIDLLQVIPTRLIQTVRNKLLRACCRVRLVGITCCESVGLVNLLQDDNNLFENCKQLGTSSAKTSC